MGTKGCNKIPSFGMEGTKKANLCSQHAEQGMVDVNSKKCRHQGCDTLPLFGSPGRTPEFCFRHSKQGMVSAQGKPAGILSSGGGGRKRGRGEQDVDAAARHALMKKPSRQARTVRSCGPCRRQAEGESEEMTGGSSSKTTGGPSKRSLPVGFTPTVPMAVKAERARRPVADPADNLLSESESESETEAASETQVAVST